MERFLTRKNNWDETLFKISEDLNRLVRPNCAKLRSTKVEELLNLSDLIDSNLHGPINIEEGFGGEKDATVDLIKVVFVDNAAISNEDRHGLMILHCLLSKDIDQHYSILSFLHLPIMMLFLNVEKSHANLYYRSLGCEMETVPASMLDSMYKDALGDASLEIYNNIMETKRSQLIAYALYGVHLCMIGKSLNPNNSTTWAQKCLMAMIGSSGLGSLEELIGTIYPTLQAYKDFSSIITISTPLRAAIVLRLIKMKNTIKSSHIKNLMEAVLLRLKFADMLAFKLVDTYLVSTNMYLFLMGDLATRIDSIISVYTIIARAGDMAPYLKLMTDPQQTPQLNDPHFKMSAEIARQVGIITGNTTLENVKFGVVIKDLVELQDRIRNIIGIANKSIFGWVTAPVNKILDPRINGQFYNVLTSGLSEDQEEENQVAPRVQQ